MAGIDAAHWTSVADDWIAWAGTPGHDVFWRYKACFADFVGPGPGRALEIGCGEGRISRLLSDLGWSVTASDVVPAMLEAARAAESAAAYCLADARSVPLPDAGFDLVVAYNVLMDVEDVDGTVREAARLMNAGGRLVISIVHPIADLTLESADGAGTTYFDRRRFDEVWERDGLKMHFAGWAAPLQHYFAALAAAGLAVTALREPEPEPKAGQERSALPVFLWLEARRLAAGG